MDEGDIYVITNLINNKMYIGQAKQYKINGYCHGYLGRWKSHLAELKMTDKGCRILNNAMKKYGVENFSVELVLSCKLNEIDWFEQFCISYFETLHPNGYNIRSGGKDGYHCQNSRELMRQKKLGSNNHNFGKPRTAETKQKISFAKKGDKHHFYGKELSYNHKLNLSKSHKKYDTSLPMYIAYVKERPKNYCAAGYAVSNHPIKKNKYFTSKKLSLEEKYELALEYLNN